MITSKVMKIYIGTLVEKCADGQVFIQTHVSGSHYGLAFIIADALSTEERERNIEIPRDIHDILYECERGNQDDGSGPLSIGEDADLSHEFLLSTTIEEF